MNAREAMSWVRARCGRLPPAVEEGLRRRTALLEDSTRGGGTQPDYFEVALDSEKLFRRVKLVHVTRFPGGVSDAVRRKTSRSREAALTEIFRSTPGLALKELKRMYDALHHSKVEDFLPTASVECDLSTGTFTEISLYSDDAPAPLMAPLCRSLGAVPEDPNEVPEAVGYDFRPGSPCRAKLYCLRPLAELKKDPRCALSLAPFPERWFAGRLLALSRAAEGGAWERGKIYLSYIARHSPSEACRTEALAADCPAGPLRRFLDALAAAAPGHVVDYLGADGPRFEAYVGLPVFDRAARGEGRGGEDLEH